MQISSRSLSRVLGLGVLFPAKASAVEIFPKANPNIIHIDPDEHWLREGIVTALLRYRCNENKVASFEELITNEEIFTHNMLLQIEWYGVCGICSFYDITMAVYIAYKIAGTIKIELAETNSPYKDLYEVADKVLPWVKNIRLTQPIHPNLIKRYPGVAFNG